MVASDWNDQFILHLDENNEFYHLDYYSTAKDCDDKLNVKKVIPKSNFCNEYIYSFQSLQSHLNPT